MYSKFPITSKLRPAVFEVKVYAATMPRPKTCLIETKTIAS